MLLFEFPPALEGVMYAAPEAFTIAQCPWDALDMRKFVLLGAATVRADL